MANLTPSGQSKELRLLASTDSASDPEQGALLPGASIAPIKEGDNPAYLTQGGSLTRHNKYLC